MRYDPKNETLTEWQLNVLSNIFRLILKEVSTDADKDKLAPGEVGINYKEGAFYIRNPHNGKLFSPNSLEHMKQILSKFNPGTTIFNADRVNGISFYTKLSQLDQLGLNFTPDMVIRQMRAPAIFLGPIEYENGEVLGWPSNAGLCMAFKGSEDHAIIRFTDTASYQEYSGRYNKFSHMFEGWASAGNSSDVYYTETVGGGDSVHLILPEDAIRDLSVVTVRVTEDINPGATITINDLGPFQIVNRDGTPLDERVAENNVIMLIYDEPGYRWIMLDSTESVLQYTVELLQKRLSESDRKFTDAIQQIRNDFDQALSAVVDTYEKKIQSLEEAIVTRPGNILANVVNFTAAANGISEITLSEEYYEPGVDKLVVNYGQTLLRVGLDYTVENNIVRLLNTTLAEGDVVQLIIIKQKTTL